MYNFKKYFSIIKFYLRNFYFQYIRIPLLPKITEIKCSPVQSEFKNKKLLIILRGETFRDNNRCDLTSKYTKLSSQEYCVKQFIKHVLLVIKKKYPDLNIEVRLITYPHPKNIVLKEIINKYALCKLEELEKSKNNQVTTFLHSMKTAIEEKVAAVLIIRVDIAFINDLCVDNFCQNKVLFQWNLLHNKKTLEVPDQIHFIGSNVISKLYKSSLSPRRKFVVLAGDDNTLKLQPTCLLDQRWEGTMHNFLFFCLQSLNLNQIGYLNYLEDPDIKKIECDVRGHPNSRMGNPLYIF